MTHFFIKLSIMMALLLINTFAAVTAYMRGTRPTEVLDGSLKTRSLAAIVAAGRQRHLVTYVDKVQGLVHDAKLLAASRGSSGLIPSSAGGMSGFDGNEQETDDCVDMEVHTWQNDVTNPLQYTDDTTGDVLYYFEVKDVTETAIGAYFKNPSLTADVNGYCEMAGFWGFYDDADGDVILTAAKCDGSRYTFDDGTEFDQRIIAGSGKYECATGSVTQGSSWKDQSGRPDLVYFQIEYCIDPSTCV
jgi:hypothetical protein